MKVREALVSTDKVRRNGRRIKFWRKRASKVASDLRAGIPARAQAMAALPLLSELERKNRHSLFFLAHCPKARKTMKVFLNHRDMEQIEGSVVDDRAYKEANQCNRLLAEHNVLSGCHMAAQVDKELAEAKVLVGRAEKLANSYKS